MFHIHCAPNRHVKKMGWIFPQSWKQKLLFRVRMTTTTTTRDFHLGTCVPHVDNTVQPLFLSISSKFRWKEKVCESFFFCFASDAFWLLIPEGGVRTCVLIYLMEYLINFIAHYLSDGWAYHFWSLLLQWDKMSYKTINKLHFMFKFDFFYKFSSFLLSVLKWRHLTYGQPFRRKHSSLVILLPVVQKNLRIYLSGLAENCQILKIVSIGMQFRK